MSMGVFIRIWTFLRGIGGKIIMLALIVAGCIGAYFWWKHDITQQAVQAEQTKILQQQLVEEQKALALAQQLNQTSQADLAKRQAEIKRLQQKLATVSTQINSDTYTATPATPVEQYTVQQIIDDQSGKATTLLPLQKAGPVDRTKGRIEQVINKLKQDLKGRHK